MSMVNVGSDEECLDAEDGPCRGTLEPYTSKSGCTTVMRCERHGREYLDRMQDLDDRLNRDYPGWDNQHSLPPSWFDPANAGETW